MLKVWAAVSMFIYLGLGNLNSQVFKEDFNSGTALSSWILIDVDGRTPALSRFTNAWILSQDSSVADSCASSTSYYNPLGQSDDWMISPAIALGATNTLSWEGRVQDPRFPDGYEIRISTTNPDTASFLNNPPLFSIAAENPTWTKRSINLQAAGYSNQTVYLAWRNNSNDEYILHIDNIIVDSLIGNDAEMIAGNQIVNEFWRIPLQYSSSLNLSCSITNVGADTLYGLKGMCDIFLNGNKVHTDSTQTQGFLAPTDTVQLSVSNAYSPSIAGNYHVRYYTKFIGIDSDSSNNYFTTDTLKITDTTFARDNGVMQSSIGIGPGIHGELGCIYNINQVDTISSISIFIANVNGQMTGQQLSVNIRGFNSIPTTLIASSDTLTYSSSSASWVTLTFHRNGGYVPLQAGPFFIGIVEGDSNLTLGTTAQTYNPGVNFIKFPGGITNGWNRLEDYNQKPALMIRPNFAAVSFIVSTNGGSNLDQNLSVFPNPSQDGIFNLKLNKQIKNRFAFQLYDINGREVKNFELINLKEGFSINLSSQELGIYILKIYNGEEMWINKLIYH